MDIFPKAMLIMFNLLVRLEFIHPGASFQVFLNKTVNKK